MSTFAGLHLPLNDADFEGFRRLLRKHTGIKLSDHKRCLVQVRLGSRLRACGVASFGDYRRLLEDDRSGEELPRFINAMTTNKTDFFREAHHFSHLTGTWAPARQAVRLRTGDATVRFWSAGCSTGEEPYTIAMTVLGALGGPGWDVRILASDIDTDVLARAQAGVYSMDQLAPVPPALVSRFFLRGKGPNAGSAQVSPAVRELVTFRRISFLDDPWPIRTRFDAIFCRNVLIYFDRPTQERVMARLIDYLKDDGLLFLGHSESAHGLVGGIAHLGSTIYRRQAEAASSPHGRAPAGR